MGSLKGTRSVPERYRPSLNNATQTVVALGPSAVLSRFLGQ